MEIIAVIKHKISESAHIDKVCNNSDKCNNYGNNSTADSTAHTNAHKRKFLSVINMSPLISWVAVTRDYDSLLHLALRLTNGIIVITVNFLIKNIAELLIKQKFKSGDNKTYKNNSAYNTLWKEEIALSYSVKHACIRKNKANKDCQKHRNRNGLCKMQKCLWCHFVGLKACLITKRLHFLIDMLLSCKAIFITWFTRAVSFNYARDFLNCVINIFVNNSLGKIFEFHITVSFMSIS